MINNSTIVKLFDRQFVANTLWNHCRCPSCRMEYSYNYDINKYARDTQQIKSNRPILLPCNHNMCENCVYQHKNNLSCHVCLKPVDTHSDLLRDVSNFNARDNFDMNFFLLGELYNLRYFRKDGSANNSLQVADHFQTPMDITSAMCESSAASSSTIYCIECEVLPATGKCQQCKLYLCKRCFDNIHEGSRIMKTHNFRTFKSLGKTSDKPMELSQKHKICRRHGRRSDRFCQRCQLVCCLDCARNDHPLHTTTTLLELNKNYAEALEDTLEQVNASWENVKQELKDIKLIEKQLEEYATKTLENVSSFFLQLHSFLQNEEKKVIHMFREMSQQPQFHIRNVYTKLFESQEILNGMRCNLLSFSDKTPKNIHVGQVIGKFNKQLQQLSCHPKISKPISNPFYFDGNLDVCLDFRKSVFYDFRDPKIILNNCSLNDDKKESVFDKASMEVSSIATPISRDSQLALTSLLPNIIPKKNKKINKYLSDSNDKIISSKQLAISPTALESDDDNFVRVSHIISPEHFYIQRINCLQKIRELSSASIDYMHCDRIPRMISEGDYYMTFYANDQQWYRSILLRILPNDLCRVFLVDIGMHLEISKDLLRDIDNIHLKIPFAAVRCAIHDIVPAGKNWNEVANNLMMELLDNSPAHMVVREIGNNMLMIDLQTCRTNSVRQSFLYVGLALERPGVMNSKIKHQAIKSKIRLCERIPKAHLNLGDVLKINMLCIEGPQKFFVNKSDLSVEKHKLTRDINTHYDQIEEKRCQLFLGSVGMCCAVLIDKIWHRAVILEIKQRGLLVVNLVDEGRQEQVLWRQAFVLPHEFREKSEFAICCSLADVEPLQDNSYVYTSSAINDFKQMTTNPCLRMEVVDLRDTEYRVVLYVCKKNFDLNIGAALVKNGHAVPTGDMNQVLEFSDMSSKIKMNDNSESENNIQILSSENKESTSISTLSIERTPVIVVYFVDPGEFYIQLSSLRNGTKAFHLQIQETQRKEFPLLEMGIQSPTTENHNWSVNDHCLVYCTYESCPTLIGPAKDCEWHRGIIKDISLLQLKEPIFSIFLRDIGATIKSTRNQIYPIDPQLDRVSNAVYCCHLACIEPANGKTWSHSAYDWFRHLVVNSELLSVSMYGERSKENPSIPVILWSSNTETKDPLAPCIKKYVNINRELVKLGLACMTERLDTANKFERIEKIELSEGEITLEHWNKLCEANIVLSASSNIIQDPMHMSVYTMDKNSEDETSNAHPLSVYLKDFEFSPTTGQNKPPPLWETSKDINKTLFNGYPTYVDYNCIVYLHDADDKSLLEAMSSIISKHHSELPQVHADYKYTKGQPVIAQYHVDKKFYRAIVTSNVLNVNGELEVFFVDYGNVEELRPESIKPYAPYPHLPSIANKFIISGIQPKGGAIEYIQADLDQMHVEIVGKLVSVRLAPSELVNNIKTCSMRLGTEDVRTLFIKKKLAEKADKRSSPLSQTLMDLNGTRVFKYFGSNEKKCSKHSTSNINFLVEHLDKTLDISVGIPSKGKHNHSIDQKLDMCSSMLEKKSRMFNEKAYIDLVNGLTNFDSDGLRSPHGDKSSLDHEDNEDIVELDHKFNMNYWHDNGNKDMENEEITNNIQDEEGVLSEFEYFHPNDTSTAPSHISFHLFKMPQWPFGLTEFNCKVVSIITSTVLQIFPINSEFKLRELELQRYIKHIVEKVPALKTFENGTACLALYLKDKKWYRALIRSHNKIAKTVDVFYVDYLNCETIPVQYVRECPPDVLEWSLRTFCVRLHGVKPNPCIRDQDVRMTLRKHLAGKKLYAVLKKSCSSLPNVANFKNASSDYENLMQISLYGTQELSARAITAYDTLIENSYFLRT